MTGCWCPSRPIPDPATNTYKKKILIAQDRFAGHRDFCSGCRPAPINVTNGGFPHFNP